MTEPAVKSRYITGFCGIGCHEGTKPRSHSGVPMKVCVDRTRCSCKCHKDLDEMYELAETEREEHQNSEWSPATHSFIMPEFGVDYGMDRVALQADPIDGDTGLQGAGNGHIGASSFGLTPSGRAARGQLEEQVLEVCTEWIIDRSEVCTPAFVAWDIARFNKVEEPSTGAISAVFARWEKYGFAVIESKPARFDCFTDEGRAKGLAYMRALYKHKQRNSS